MPHFKDRSWMDIPQVKTGYLPGLLTFLCGLVIIAALASCVLAPAWPK